VRPAVASLSTWFAGRHGVRPAVIWHAPGRVNLIGEHTDYNDGLVLPFAIAPGVLAAAAPRPDGRLALSSRQVPAEPAEIDLDELEPGAVAGWAGYAAGAAWALRAAGYSVGGVSLAVDADLPAGAGLASSAALCCAAVSCLAGLRSPGLSPAFGRQPAAFAPPSPGASDQPSAFSSPSRAEIAALARSAEADFVGMPCGIMDQSACMLSAAGHALLLDCRSGASALVPLDPAAAGLQIVMADTGVRHTLADGQYAARREQCRRAARQLGVRSLREISDPGQLAALADPLLRRRARHVVTENARVRRTAGLLRDGRLADCGELLTASHASLRDDFEVSWPAADAIVSAAVSAGALGARMTGGGFGGCVLVLVPAGRSGAVTAAISTALPAPVSFLDVVPGNGASRAWPEG
jgi:galactokinase